MPDKDASTPRVYLVRHGETEWSSQGRYTGTTDLALTAQGEAQVRGTGTVFVGSNRLIDPSRLAAVYVSPLQRAQQTWNLLMEAAPAAQQQLEQDHKVHTRPELREWDYGAYEGLLTREIRARRQAQNLDQDRPWDIWTDGCEDGDIFLETNQFRTPEAFAARLDKLGDEIVALQRDNMHGERPADVLLIAHGHTLRGFTKRWLRYPMAFPLSMMLEAGGVGTLSYQHHSVDEPAFMLGVGFGGR